MLDTISGSTFIGYFEAQKKWHKCDDGIGKYKYIYLDNGAIVYMTYYPTGYLTISFSASKIQNGDNSIPYNFENNLLVEDIIIKNLEKEIGISFDLNQFKLCRLDLNKDYIYSKESDADKVLEFFNKIHPEAYERPLNYKLNGGYLHITKSRKGKRGYRKDLEQKEKRPDDTPILPTARLEFQMNKRKIKNIINCQSTIHEILKNEIEVHHVWNKLLSKSGIDLAIYPYDELLKITDGILSKSQKEILKNINNKITFKKEDRRKQLEVIRKLKKYGICAYACEIPITVKSKLFEVILNKRKKRYECTIQKQRYIITDQTSDTVILYYKWFLDSS